jgi:VWFA-related protein
MTRLVHLVVAIAAAGTFPGRIQSPAEQPASARLVIDAVATDSRGMPVMDLKPDDVEVWIGHFRVPIESLTAVTPGDERSGRLVVLLMDDVTLPAQSVPRAREVARRFVTRMTPGDRMAIVMLNGGITESTDDRSRLFKTLDGYNQRATGVSRLDDLGAHVLETIGDLSRQLAEGADQRRTIVAIGSGWLLDRPIPPPSAGHDLLPQWISAMRMLSLSNTNVYVIDPSGVGVARADAGDSGFARETGGHAFLNTNDLNGAADRIMRESANYYLIGVNSPPVGGNGLRELDVRSQRRGVTIRARRAIH